MKTELWTDRQTGERAKRDITRKGEQEKEKEKKRKKVGMKSIAKDAKQPLLLPRVRAVRPVAR